MENIVSKNGKDAYSIAINILSRGSNMKRCLPDGRTIQWYFENDTARLAMAGEDELDIQLWSEEKAIPLGGKLRAGFLSSNSLNFFNLLVALYCIFDELPQSRKIELDLSQYPELVKGLRERGIVIVNDSGVVECTRALLWQYSQLWMNSVIETPYPLRYEVTNNQRHPSRPMIKTGTIYRRFIPALDKIISFRTVAIDTDLEIFHRWMNTPRVANFWEMEGSKEEHRQYLKKALQDEHLHPLIGCFDDQPFGYFEAYWAKEDRIAPFYSADDYDRGLHMLVGEQDFRGPHFVVAWLQSLVHWLFLADPRTRNVVSEPRSDNTKMIAYLQAVGFHKMKEFNFPHKRAALVLVSREVF